MVYVIQERLCQGCGACELACPIHAISMVNGKAHIDPFECIACGSCRAYCPYEAPIED